MLIISHKSHEQISYHPHQRFQIYNWISFYKTQVTLQTNTSKYLIFQYLFNNFVDKILSETLNENKTCFKL